MAPTHAASLGKESIEIHSLNGQSNLPYFDFYNFCTTYFDFYNFCNTVSKNVSTNKGLSESQLNLEFHRTLRRNF